MNGDLLEQLPKLLPRAISWAERESRLVLEAGAAPPPQLEVLAQRVGVVEPTRIRLVAVNDFRVPEDDELRVAALSLGLFGPAMNGLTLGHAVILRRGHHFDGSLLAHEFRHVAQYEAAGSIASFLSKHLHDLATYGYEASPFEVDARAHEKYAA
jgi:hypothetical protein